MKNDNRNEQNEQRDRASEAAASVLSLARARLFTEFRYLGQAIALPELKETYNTTGISTRSGSIYYNPLHVIAAWKEDPRRLCREYLHCVLHFVFLHPFVSSSIDHKRWNLACDLAIENVLREMKSDLIECEDDAFQSALLDEIKEKAGRVTAENVYRYLNEADVPEDTIRSWSSLVYRDSHTDWYSNMHQSENAEAEQQTGETDNFSQSGISETELKELWTNISESLDVDLETFSAGEVPDGTLIQNLKSLRRERVNYAAFLRRFAVYDEEITVNDDEFDYVPYTFGLTHYGNMPLIEPLEYKESEKIRDFVIAIDTSGSVRGDLVQKFIEKTFSILSERESFFQKIRLRIMQCDDQIREEAVINDRQELDSYLKSLTLKGFGYTDFRPVFERVDELVIEKAFVHLKGLIYFTDGYGEYPKSMPNYDAAFIFTSYDDERPEPPPWAIRIVLEEDQLQETT